jgi:hypothetical protein
MSSSRTAALHHAVRMIESRADPGTTMVDYRFDPTRVVTESCCADHTVFDTEPLAIF